MNGELSCLILSGGQSQRMGKTKALLTYQDQPQIFRLAQMLGTFSNEISLSCTPEQASLFTAAGWNQQIITDLPTWGHIGPLNGLLSAFYQKITAWLVVGCDYPRLTKADFEYLILNRDQSRLATVFRHPDTGFAEPLIGIYEPGAGDALLHWFETGNQSLRIFLEQHPVKFVIPDHPDHLQSVDTPDDYLNIW